jgi:hypothetical protein
MKTFLNKHTSIIAIAIAAATLFGIISPALAATFNPNLLISDAAFNDTTTFTGAAGIQQFLTAKGSVLANTDPTFLQMLREPQISLMKEALNDPEPDLDHLRTAAELIWDSSQMTGINPQVILVTLEKEQSLIDGTFTPGSTRLQTALDHALGFSCPDSTGCSSQFGGFYFQLFGTIDAQGNHYLGAPASLMRSFTTPNGRGPAIDVNGSTLGSPLISTSHVGDTILLGNSLGGPTNPPATQEVTLGDSATAALYRYTPHVYNGNYNFWLFYSTWFKYIDGSFVQISGSPTVYIVENGQMQQIPTFVMMARGLNPSSITATTIAQSDYDAYTHGPVLAPPDGTAIKISGDSSNTYYVFEDGVKHPASQFILSQRKIDPNAAFTVSAADANLFISGSQLTPADGTLLQSPGSKTIYVSEQGSIYTLTAFTFQQYGYSFKNVITVPASELALYTNAGFLLPKDGTLIKYTTSNTVYELKDQLLDPISGTVFNLNGYSFKNVAVLNPGELANAQVGSFLPPPDGTYFYLSNGAYYLYKDSATHSISYFVFKQRKVSKVAVLLSASEAANLAVGAPLAPTDGTLIQGDASGAIYVIMDGQKVLLDYATWVKTYKKAKPNILPQAEVDGYATPSATDEGGNG